LFLLLFLILENLAQCPLQTGWGVCVSHTYIKDGSGAPVPKTVDTNFSSELLTLSRLCGWLIVWEMTGSSYTAPEFLASVKRACHSPAMPL